MFDIDALIEDISQYIMETKSDQYSKFKKFNKNLTIISSDQLKIIQQKIYNLGVGVYMAKINVPQLVDILTQIYLELNEAEIRKLFKDLNFI